MIETIKNIGRLVIMTTFFYASFINAQETTATTTTTTSDGKTTTSITPFTKEEAVKTYNLFRTAYKSRNYKEAIDYWYACFQRSPKLSVNLYKLAPTLIKNLRKTMPDFKGKNWDLLQKEVYDQYFENYADHKDMLKMFSDYANFLHALKDHSVLGAHQDVDIGGIHSCVFNAFEKVYKEDPTKLSPKSIAIYFMAVVAKDKSNMALIFETYDKLLEATQNKMVNYSKKLDEFNKLLEDGSSLSKAEEKLKKSYEINAAALGKIETILDKQLIDIATCERLEPFYKKSFEANKDNIAWIKSAASRMQKKGCNKSSFYDKLIETYVALEPSPKASVFYAGILLKKGDEDKARTYFQKAIEQETDNYKKAEYLLIIARMIGKKGNKSIARKYALESIKNRKSFGQAYLFIANLYAKSVNECGSSEFQKRMVFVAAKDMAEKAYAMDPSVRGLAKKHIRNYKANAPGKKDFFKEGLKSGTPYKIGCWIKTTVTIP